MTFESSVTARCSTELKDELEKLAKADQRKVGSYIRIVLEQHVKQAKDKQKRVTSGN